MVTIYDRPSQPRQNMKWLDAPALDGMQIKQILESYVGPQYKADVWYSECDSSPHAAHIIGENLRSNPEDILRQSETSGWDRYIAYRASATSIEFERRKKVLLWIGQFRCFGDRESYPGEYKIIEDKITEHTDIEKDAFAETIEELRRMRILRGSDILHMEPNTLHVAPKILRVWLWREWHKKYGSSLEPFPLDGMWDRAKSDNAYRNLLYWHVDMWQYDETGNPHHAVNGVFKSGGFADRHALLGSHFGADILYKMSKASPEDAVSYLERYVGALGMDGLQRFKNGRWQAAMILADAAGRSSLFRRAARILLLLAGTGCQEADDADNMFVRLFLPAAESVGWTETPLAERVPLLKDALTHKITDCRLVGINACEAALQVRHFVKDIVDDEAWQRGVIWMPKGRMEYVEYYRKVLDLVRTHLKDLNKEERERLAKVVLPRTRDLLEAPELHDAVLTLLREIHDGQHADPEIVIGTISDCMEYGRNKMPEDLQHNLSQLHDEIVGDSYHDYMRRYVAMNVFADFQIPDDIWQETITNLAKRSLNDPQAFNQELVWLVTDEATHGYGFGYALGKMDDGSLFASIHGAQQLHVKSRAVFMGGYLRAVFDKDRCEWERLMHSLAANPILHGLVSALTSMSGMTDKMAIRILELVESEIDPTTLRAFEHGTRVCDVPEAVFQKWLGLLVDGSAETYKVALNLYHKYYVRGKRHIPHSVKSLLFPRNDSHRIRHTRKAIRFWLKILTSYVRQGPTTADVVSDVVGMVIVTDAYSMPDRELMPALEAVAEHHPDKTWEAISALIDPDKNPSVHMRRSVWRAFFINKTLVEKITLSIIYGWIDKDVERRATIVASLLPHDIKMAAEYAAKYGEVEGVKKVLIGNLQFESFSGSWLEHYRNKINTVDSLMAKEDRPIALEFLEEYRDILSERCDRA